MVIPAQIVPIFGASRQSTLLLPLRWELCHRRPADADKY